MKTIFKTLIKILTLEFFNTLVHTLLRPKISDTLALDIFSMSITVILAIYAGWRIAKNIGFNWAVVFKATGIFWFSTLVFTLISQAFSFFLYPSYDENIQAIIGYLIAWIFSYLFLAILITIGGFISRFKT